LIDWGKWLNEEYRISEELPQPPQQNREDTPKAADDD
jgi:endogenous inhibitor of DNA gyrase (YacG/DUF329 family)